jgi:hypothetical protein
MSASRQGTPWGISLQGRVVIALVSALIIAAKFYLRMPLHVPGHSGVLWMALLIIGAGLVRRPGAGTLIGLLTAVLAVMFVPGREGIFVGVKYFVPGVIVDVLTPVLGGRLDRYPTAMAVGACAHVGKLTAAYLMGLALGVPSGFLALGLGFATTTHVAFGLLGGLLGAFVLIRLTRAGIPRQARPALEEQP